MIVNGLKENILRSVILDISQLMPAAILPLFNERGVLFSA